MDWEGFEKSLSGQLLLVESNGVAKRFILLARR